MFQVNVVFLTLIFHKVMSLA